ncbi:MAG TPA: circadian clock KaiB family protein [Longimicrobiales bacterium]|nr:circadian clock KaiB family protein [Longimicrobiales bacterium]
MTIYRFFLFVTGATPRTEQAIANLRRLCDEQLQGNYELTIVDVLDRPEVAEQERILATPMLVKEAPLPRRRITGDLSDPRQVLTMLGLNETAR